MFISVFDLFKIGVGPSSSHTVGPMKAAARFAASLKDMGVLDRVAGVRTELYGSLALTGKGHATDVAVLMGLAGAQPETIDPDTIAPTLETIRDQGRLVLGGLRDVAFSEARDLVFEYDKTLPAHTNGMICIAVDAEGRELARETYYSIGGGFVVTEAEITRNSTEDLDAAPVPHPFATGEEMLARGRETGLSVARMMWENECARRPEQEVRDGLDRIWDTMDACMTRGLNTEGELPGGLKVKRRAPTLRKHLTERAERHLGDASAVMDWINLYALAVSEENAAGGRVVTAPTNGAAGIIPAVIRYFERFCPIASREGIHNFLLAAAAVGSLYKRNASISGAEVGCQGEVGVACSMAAAGLVAALNGTNEQLENAAEIGMEHNLGLTCDPVKGLVQVPCIERNAVGATKAVNAARIALWGDGQHTVSLDKVIETMRQTGADMQSKYKETSRGGLAVNVVEC